MIPGNKFLRVHPLRGRRSITPILILDCVLENEDFHFNLLLVGNEESGEIEPKGTSHVLDLFAKETGESCASG